MIPKKNFELIKQGLNEFWLSEKEFAYLNKKYFSIPDLCTLSKVHKDIERPPGHPIVARCNSILKSLAEYVDFFIKPFVPLTASYIKDSRAVNNHLEGESFDATHELLATMDILSLYLNILQNEALEIIHSILETRPHTHRIPSSFIVDCANVTLGQNNFIFYNDFFAQIKK